jgi:transcriptional regulator with PAS, ATPase and Fis domain
MRSRLESLVEEMVDRKVRFEDAMREFEKCFITKVMERNRGNLSKTAKELGIHRNTLSNRLREYRPQSDSRSLGKPER